MKKRRFNEYERGIIGALYRERRPMSLREISKASNSSWVTTKKYTNRLVGRNIAVFKTGRLKRQKVSFNFDILKRYRRRRLI